MAASDEKADKSWFRKLGESPDWDDSYEPLCLWLLPILFRSRKKYYNDTVAKTKNLVEWYWNTSSKYAFNSRDDFEQSDFVQEVWDREAPLWWGLNDIIGWIDVRLCVRKGEIQVLLFVPTKRISRQLKDKTYYCCLQKSIALFDRSTNEEMHSLMIELVETVVTDSHIKKCYVDLTSWRRLVHHTDLIGIIRDVAQAELERR